MPSKPIGRRCAWSRGNAGYQGWLGAELLRYGRVEEASRVLARAAQMAPDHADTWKRLGYAYAELEKRDEAITAYRQALRFDPDDTARSANSRSC